VYRSFGAITGVPLVMGPSPIRQFDDRAIREASRYFIEG
jgi:hypothetical protein